MFYYFSTVTADEIKNNDKINALGMLEDDQRVSHYELVPVGTFCIEKKREKLGQLSQQGIDCYKNIIVTCLNKCLCLL